MQSNLIGVDRRGGTGYKEVFCEICGNSLFIGKNSESGICARCVQFGYPKVKPKINRVMKNRIERETVNAIGIN